LKKCPFKDDNIFSNSWFESALFVSALSEKPLINVQVREYKQEIDNETRYLQRDQKEQFDEKSKRRKLKLKFLVHQSFGATLSYFFTVALKQFTPEG
jgi:hypothetical protein